MIYPLAVVIRHDYFFHGADKGRNGKIRGVVNVYDDVVEGGGHPDEVYEPNDGPFSAIQSEVDQPREDEWNRGPGCPRQGNCPVIQVQHFEGRVLLEDPRELKYGVPAIPSIGKEEFQRSELGRCVDGGQGIGQEVSEVKFREFGER